MTSQLDRCLHHSMPGMAGVPACAAPQNLTLFSINATADALTAMPETSSRHEAWSGPSWQAGRDPRGTRCCQGTQSGKFWAALMGRLLSHHPPQCEHVRCSQPQHAPALPIGPVSGPRSCLPSARSPQRQSSNADRRLMRRFGVHVIECPQAQAARA